MWHIINKKYSFSLLEITVIWTKSWTNSTLFINYWTEHVQLFFLFLHLTFVRKVCFCWYNIYFFFKWLKQRDEDIAVLFLYRYYRINNIYICLLFSVIWDKSSVLERNKNNFLLRKSVWRTVSIKNITNLRNLAKRKWFRW